MAGDGSGWSPNPNPSLILISGSLCLTLSEVSQGMVFDLGAHMFLPVSEEPPTDIGLPCEKVSRAKELKERKRILRENRQNPEMERAARLRTSQCPGTSLPAPAALGVQLLPLHPPLSPCSAHSPGRRQGRVGEDQRPVPQAARGPALRRVPGPAQGGHLHPLGGPEGALQPGGRAPRASLLWERGDSLRGA